MSRHDPLVRMKHMLDHAREAVELLGDMSQEDLAKHRERQLALTRLIEIVGEAANKISPEDQACYPQLPWREAIGMRHVIAHGYDIVEYTIIWDTVRNNLPPLIEQLREVLDNEPDISS